MSAEFLEELPPEDVPLRRDAAEYEELLDKIEKADGKWVHLRDCTKNSAKSFRNALSAKANSRRIFIDTDQRVLGGAVTVYGRLVKADFGR